LRGWEIPVLGWSNFVSRLHRMCSGQVLVVGGGSAGTCHMEPRNPF